MGDTLAASFELRHPLRHVFKNMRLRVVRVVILTALFETGYSGRVLSDFDLCTSLRMVLPHLGLEVLGHVLEVAVLDKEDFRDGQLFSRITLPVYKGSTHHSLK